MQTSFVSARLNLPLPFCSYPIVASGKYILTGLLLWIGCSLGAQNEWNIQFSRSVLDCPADSVCYDIEVQSASTTTWALGDQNYRLFFDGDLMTVTSVTSLLPGAVYGDADIDQNLKFTGMGQEAVSPLDDIDDHLGFLDFSIVQSDKNNPNGAVQLPIDTFTATARICIDVPDSAINGNACLSFYHSRPSTAGMFTNQYTTMSENNAPGSTIAAEGNDYNDLTFADTTVACLRVPCNGTVIYECPGLMADIGDPCDDGDPNTTNDTVQSDCTCSGTVIYECPNLQANIGDACDDGDSNTENDTVQSDCTCQGTPVNTNCNVTYTVSGDTIRINNITGNITSVKVFDQAFSTIFSCDDWTTPCNSSEEFVVPGAGTYFIQVQTYVDWSTPVCNIFEEINIGVTPPPGPCSITATVSNIQCDNRGTSTDDDDTFSFDVTANITNGGSWGYDVVGTTVVMQANGTTATVGGLLISAGTVTFTVRDHDKADCTTTITVTPPAPCSTGNLCDQQGGDADGDGICANQDCDDNDASIGKPGDLCDDGNANTINDTLQSDCTCQGTPVSTTCDVTYTVSGDTIRINNITGNISAVKVLDQGFNTIFACDNWTTPCNSSEEVVVPGAGTYFIQVQTYVDWSTPVCNIFEEINIGVTPPPGPCSIAATVSNIQCDDRGTSIDDDDTFSFDVTANITNGGSWGYDVLGTTIIMQQNGTTATVGGLPISGGAVTFTVRDHDKADCTTTITVTPPAPCSTGSPCDQQGGDADGDGICANQDCDDNDASIGKPGDSCDDGDSNTINDTLQSDCTCQGTPVNNTCNVTYQIDGMDVIVSNLTDAIVSVKLLDAQYQTVEECNTWTTACGNTVTFTAPSIGTYYLQVKTYADWSTPICDILETLNITGTNRPCDDFTNPGLIKGDETICEGEAAGPVYNLQYPSGGSGAVEYMWIKNTTGCGSTGWEIIENSNTSNFDPGILTETTYFRRCARRAGCTEWKMESNCFIKTVDKNCNGTGNCDATYEVTQNTVTVSGLNGPIKSFNLFDINWGTVYSCNDWTTPCNLTETVSSLDPGTYYLQIKTYIDWQTPVCDIFETISVGSNGSSQRVTIINSFDAKLEQGVTNLGWTNNTGYMNDIFEVERSTDGVNFESILTQESESEDDTPKHYRGMDTAPETGFNHYRLKIKYLDGTFSYSEVKTVRIEAHDMFNVFPNPAGDFVHISLKAFRGENIEIQLVDHLGRIREQVELEQVSEPNYLMDLNRYNNGIYGIRIFSDSFKTQNKKLIINKGY